MGKEKKTKPPVSEDNEDNLDMDLMALIGGEKRDLELVDGVEDDDEIIDCGEDLEAEPIRKNELRDFIAELGFNKIMNFIEEDGEGKKKKSKTDKADEEDAEDEQDEDETEGKKKKSKKVKDDESGKDSPKDAPPDSDEVKPNKKKKKNKFKLQDEEISSTTVDADLSFIQEHQGMRKYLLVKPGTKWTDNLFANDPESASPLTEVQVKELYNHAEQLYQSEVALYKQQQDQSRKSDVSWLRTVMSTGTLKDKMAAVTVVTQESPVQNLPALENLVTTAKKKGRREAIMAVGTLKDLFLSELLPDDRKLKAFDQHPLSRLSSLASGNKDARDKRLILWYYEAQLRDKYAEFVNALEVLCHDNILAAKQKALCATLDLLVSKPEQEKKLLSILSNKLGDPDYKVASKASFLLTKLVEKHPNMKNVIVAEVERLMYRQNITPKTQYYAVCFLNQIILSHDESELAVRLINIYFSFFKAFVKKGDVDSKMLRGLLTGVNRAYHYAKVNSEKVAEQMDTLYKIVHIVNFNTSVQALMLLFQVMDTSENTSDRYYQALYKKLSDPDLVHSSKQAMFLNLVFKSLSKDDVDRRVKAFIKRLLQVCFVLPVPFVCGAMVLLSEIMKAKPSLFQFFQISGDDEEEHFRDIKDELDDDDEEHFDDVKEEIDDDKDHSVDVKIEKDDAEEKQKKDMKIALGHRGHVTVPSWVHKKNISGGDSQGQSSSQDYDPHNRNPLYARADTECVWELARLSAHFHPSVALFAQTLLQGKLIEYTGDPLEDFTLIRFLDRFVFRNPKKKDKRQPGLRAKPLPKTQPGVKSLAVNTDEYLQTEEDQIPVDEKFFYKYYKKQASKKKVVEEEDDSEVEDDEFDDFLEGYEKTLEGADNELDFAGEFTKKAFAKKMKVPEDDDTDEDDFGGDLSDEEVDFGDLDMGDFEEEDGDEDQDEDQEDGGDFEDKEFSGEEPEFDEEDIAFSDEDEDMDAMFAPAPVKIGSKSGGKRQADDAFFDEPPPMKKKGKKSKDPDPANLFAAAEEFSHLMDENTTSSKAGGIGTEAMANKDNADAKQLNWEANRDRWMRGQDWKSKRNNRPKSGGFRGGNKGKQGGGFKGKQGGGAKKFGGGGKKFGGAKKGNRK